MTSYDPLTSPHCPYHKDCVRLLDDLLDSIASPIEVLELEPGDTERLSQLSAHLPTCSACRSTVTRAKKSRDYLRIALQDILLTDELAVPSTTPRALAAIHAENRPQVRPFRPQQHSYLRVQTQPLPVYEKARAPSGHFSPTRTLKHSTRNGLALAVVAMLLLAVFGLIRYQVSQQSSFASYQFSSQGWDNLTFMRKSVDSGATTLFSISSAMLSHSTLAPPAGLTTIEQSQVSPDGKNLFYSGFDANNVLNFYTLQSGARKGPLYSSFGDQSAQALWLDNQQLIFVTNDQGIFTINIHTGKQSTLFPRSFMGPGSLQFYQNGYLYFMDNEQLGHLMRFSLTNGSIDQISRCPDGHNFKLSNDGKTVAFECISNSGIYEVNVDGTNNHLVHAQAGETLVGFAPDGSLLVMQSEAGKNTLKRLLDSNLQEQTLVDEIAPGALFIHDENIYLAPDGHALVVIDESKNGSDDAWLTELDGTSKVRELTSASTGQLLIFVGWSKLANLKY